MTVDIEQLLDNLLKVEGGYTNNPADKGGPTNFGITEQEARAHGYTGDMRLLPLAVAKEIYRQRYWIDPGFDQIATYMPRLAAELFDTGVNMGPKKASEFLQHGLNVLNRTQGDYPDINVDGDIGRMTIYSLQRLIAKRGVVPAETVLLRICDGLQLARYVAIADANPGQEVFEWGWIMNRIGNIA